MAQGNNFHMSVLIEGVDLEALDSIEFVFKQTQDYSGKTLKSARWVNDGSGDAISDSERENVVLIPWTRAETYRFQPGEVFYFQARMHISGTMDEPFVPIVPLLMEPTLFDRED
jgi:hypothetical protein